MSKKNKKNTNSTYEVVRKIRGDWGNINPVTKIIPNKKKDYNFEHEYEIEAYEDWEDYYD